MNRKRQREEQPSQLDRTAAEVTDERFASLHWDPRFSRIPKRVSKVDVDDRFKAALQTNPHFRGSSAPVDRFGRPRREVRRNGTLERLYNIADSDDGADGSGEDAVDDDNELEADGPCTHKPQLAASGSSVAESDSDGLVDDDRNKRPPAEIKLLAGETTSGEDTDNSVRKEVVPRGSATRRVAVIGLDWSKTRAVDIFASLQSFCPRGKVLHEVKVFPSKLGLERLAHEATLGPQVLSKLDTAVVTQARESGDSKRENGQGAVHRSCYTETPRSQMIQGHGNGEGALRRGDQGRLVDSRSQNLNESAVDCVTSDDDHDEDDESHGETVNHHDETDEDSDEYEDTDDGRENVVESKMEEGARELEEQDALRKYEEERLKYYYAVAEFDDAKTADAVYDHCDGVEFESTGLAMDLRFVPDDMVIDGPVRDSAMDIPDGYRPPNLAPSNLNNSRVKLSWDADAPDRAIMKKKRFGKHEEDDINLKAYLADSSDEEVGSGRTAEALEEKRRLLLNGNDGDDGEKDADMEMEVTFDPGLLEKGDEIVKRKALREERKDETAWEARLRRMQDRKAEKRKSRRTVDQSNDVEDSDGSRGNYDHYLENQEPRAARDAVFADPFFTMDSEELRREGDGDVGDGDRKRVSKHALSVSKRQAAEQYVCEDDEKETARRKAELELLMMVDDRQVGPDGSVSARLRDAESDDEVEAENRERRKGRARGRRRSEREQAERERGLNVSGVTKDDRATIPNVLDVQDDRFSGLFSSHLFALDPTHPKFKRNSATELILREKARRSQATGNSTMDSGDGPRKNKIKLVSREEVAADPEDDLMALAASVKAKSSLDIARRRAKTKVGHHDRKMRKM